MPKGQPKVLAIAATSPTLDEVLPTWFRSLRAARKSPQTLRTYDYAMRYFLAWLAEEQIAPDLDTLDQATLEDYLIALSAARSSATTAAYWAALVAFLNWCERTGMVERSPSAYIARPHVEVQPQRVPTTEEVQRLLAVCEGKTFLQRRDLTLLLAIAETGLRRAEAAQVALVDVNLDYGIIEVRHAKGGAYRAVAIGEETIEAIALYQHVRRRHPRASDPALWIGGKGGLSGQGVYDILRRRARQAGLEEMALHPHLLRHWWAHNYLDAGGSELDLKVQGGWTSLRQVEATYGKARELQRSLDGAHRLGLGRLLRPQNAKNGAKK